MFPIKHVIIITKENHTFDNYFGSFPGTTGVTLPHAKDPHPDQGHGHAAWLKEKGASGVTGAAKTQYLATDIPAYWAFAQQYTLCDNYFTDVASQSEPNHLFLIAADSPVIDNSSHGRNYQPQPPFDIPSLPHTLEAAGHTWRNYAEPNSSYFHHIKALQGHRWNVPSAQFDTDVATGFLPDVSWLYAPFGNSEHPWEPDRPPGRPMDRAAGAESRQEPPVGQHRHHHHLGRLGRLVRSCEVPRPVPLGRRRVGRLSWFAVPLRSACTLSCGQPLCQSADQSPFLFSHQRGEVLSPAVRSDGVECTGAGPWRSLRGPL